MYITYQRIKIICYYSITEAKTQYRVINMCSKFSIYGEYWNQKGQSTSKYLALACSPHQLITTQIGESRKNICPIQQQNTITKNMNSTKHNITVNYLIII